MTEPNLIPTLGQVDTKNLHYTRFNYNNFRVHKLESHLLFYI